MRPLCLAIAATYAHVALGATETEVTALDFTGYTETVLDPSNSFKVYTKSDDTDIYIVLAADVVTSGWFGLGFAEPTSGHMKGSDIVTATIADNETTIEDRWADFAPVTVSKEGIFTVESSLTAKVDVHNDYEHLYTCDKDGAVYIAMKRKFETGDTQDRDICNGDYCNMIWAWGAGSTPGFHGNNRGNVKIHLRGNAPKTEFNSDGYVDFEVPSYTIPASKRTTYAEVVFSFSSTKLDITSPKHLVAFEVIPSTAAAPYLHHITLTAYKKETKFLQAFKGKMWAKYEDGAPHADFSDEQEREERSGMFYAWALGGGTLIMPDDVGFKVSKETTDIDFIVVQVHYDNPKGDADVVDTSKVRFYYVDTPRTHDAFMLTVGDPTVSFTKAGKQIEQKTKDQHFYGTCPQSCTDLLPDDTTLNFFNVFLHMHYFGHRIFLEHYDSNGDYTDTVARTDFWDNGFQPMIPTSFTVKNGEMLQTHCFYNTHAHDEGVTNFGEGTDEEMCMAFLIGYPRKIKDGRHFDMCGFTHYEVQLDNGNTLTADTICSLEPSPGLQYEEQVVSLKTPEARFGQSTKDGNSITSIERNSNICPNETTYKGYATRMMATGEYILIAVALFHAIY